MSIGTGSIGLGGLIGQMEKPKRSHDTSRQSPKWTQLSIFSPRAQTVRSTAVFFARRLRRFSLRRFAIAAPPQIIQQTHAGQAKLGLNAIRSGRSRQTVRAETNRATTFADPIDPLVL